MADAPGLVRLCAQLGRHAALDDVRGYLQRAPGEASDCLLVAQVGEALGGWLEVVQRSALATSGWAEISGLVVEASLRKCGVGGALVRGARAWAKEKGLSRLRVRTRVEREAAASFYERAGFCLTKQQRVYELDV
jgi:GNAT superfamily N-acetyltransferase